jgi:hypothetical protein
MFLTLEITGEERKFPTVEALHNTHQFCGKEDGVDSTGCLLEPIFVTGSEQCFFLPQLQFQYVMTAHTLHGHVPSTVFNT